MFPADRKPDPVTIEYDCRNKRSSKTFNTSHAAKSFYVSKFRAVYQPTVQRSDVMSTETKAAPTKKVSAKKKSATPKKEAKKKATATATAVECGIEREKDLPWNEKKVAVFKALKQLKAVGATNAQGAVAVAEKAGLTTRDVRHYCYHAQASGLTGMSNVEDVRGYAFYLTAKGVKVDPAALLKAREDSKKNK